MYTRNQQRAQRYNKPGTFVPSTQHHNNEANIQDNDQHNNQPPLPTNCSQRSNINNFVNAQNQPQQDMQEQKIPPVIQQQQTLDSPPLPPLPAKEEFAGQMDIADTVDDHENEEPAKKPWMKPKGVVKLSNRERRRRQNERLSKVLIPKNALMILNEMNQGEAQFSVEPVTNVSSFGDARMGGQFMATLNADGNEYKGFALSKVLARNDAAEQAIRDLILKKMEKQGHRLLNSDSGDGNVGNIGNNTSSGDVEMTSEEDDSIPIIKLASFALHKLFSEWQAEGFKIPSLGKAEKGLLSRGSSVAGSDVAQEGNLTPAQPKKVKEPKALPADAAQMHPCMLLSQMLPKIEYQEISVEGDKPQNMMFTMGVNIEGATYIGRASNKKEARKNAARSACQSVLGIKYNSSESVTA